MSLASADLVDLDPAPRAAGRRPFVVEEGAQGYAIRAREERGVALLALQAMSGATGLLLAVAALALLAGEAEGTSWMRIGLALHLGSAAAMLLWYASRGALAELQVDVARGELREVVRHRLGRATVLASHGLDAVEALEVEPARGRGEATLLLRLGGSDALLFVARGPLAPIHALRRRLASDLSMHSQGLVRAMPADAALAA